MIRITFGLKCSWCTVNYTFVWLSQTTSTDHFILVLYKQFYPLNRSCNSLWDNSCCTTQSKVFSKTEGFNLSSSITHSDLTQKISNKQRDEHRTSACTAIEQISLYNWEGLFLLALRLQGESSFKKFHYSCRLDIAKYVDY